MFEVDIHHPIEIMDLFFNTEKGKREYCIYYSIKGELPTDRIEIKKDGAIVIFKN